VASAGPYANLHISPDKEPRQHPTTQFLTGWMPFLPPNQQRQSTEGIIHTWKQRTNLLYKSHERAYNVKNDEEQIKTRQQWVLQTNVLHRSLVLVVLNTTADKQYPTSFYYISCNVLISETKNKYDIKILLAANFFNSLRISTLADGYPHVMNQNLLVRNGTTHVSCYQKEYLLIHSICKR